MTKFQNAQLIFEGYIAAMRLAGLSMKYIDLTAELVSTSDAEAFARVGRIIVAAIEGGNVQDAVTILDRAKMVQS